MASRSQICNQLINKRLFGTNQLNDIEAVVNLRNQTKSSIVFMATARDELLIYTVIKEVESRIFEHDN